MRFADPWWLALIPLVVLLFWWRSRKPPQATVLYSNVRELKRLPRTWAQRVRPFLVGLPILGLVLLAVAMARPQSGREDSRVASYGIAIQLVIDVSGSMGAGDMDPDPYDAKAVTRLDAVKDVVRDFIDADGELKGRSSDLVGLISFATYVQTHCPLTLDHGALLALLRNVQMPGDPRDPNAQELLKTAIGDALIVGVDRLADLKVDSRVMVLLSDGSSNVGEAKPTDGAETAREKGIKVYTIGVGTPSQGLDEETLEKVAEITGGRYFNARSADALKRIYQEIDQLERSELESFQYTRWKERFPWFLVAGLGLLVAYRLLMDTRFRSLP